MQDRENEIDEEFRLTSDYQGPSIELDVKPKSMVGHVNKKANSDHGIYLKTSYRCKEVSVPFNLLIDSGASKSLMHRSVLDKIPQECRPELQKADTQIRFADGSIQSITGMIKLPILIGQDCKLVEFLVGEYTDDAILGMKDLKRFGITIDFEKNLVTKGDLWLPAIDISSVPLLQKVIVRRTCVLAPRSQSIIQATVKQRKGQKENSTATLMMTPTHSVISELGVLPAKTLHDSNKKVIPVLMYNSNSEPVLLEPETVIGLMESVQEMPLYDDEVQVDDRKECRNVREEVSNEELPDHLKNLYTRSVENLSENEKELVKKFLKANADVYSKHEYDLGRTTVLEHELPVDCPKPIRSVPYRMTKEKREAANAITNKLLEEGLISPSKSPWASPILLVKKKNGSYRMVIDYRKLNEVSHKDAFSLPRIDETLDSLSGSKYFCANDLSSGYWQVGLAEKDRKKTAFCTDRGLFEWNVMAFGLSSAPATFQRLMETILADLRYESLLVYLDDVIVFGKTVEQTLERLSVFCDRLRKAQLKLRPEKCHYFQTSVTYLGHVVTAEGISTCSDKVDAVKLWATPKNKKEVKSFLGLSGYYRRFIPNYSAIAKPLYAVTGQHEEFKWDDNCQKAFDQLKELLTTAPVLGYPDDHGMFILDCDASGTGIGCTLSQIQEDKEKVIAYSSKLLTKEEMNYCVTRRELLAIVHHISLYKCYLTGRHFKVRTDHGALKYLNRFKEPEGQLARWIDFLQSFDYEIVLRSGVKHCNADALSRRPPCCEKESKKCYCQKFKALEYEPPVVIETTMRNHVSVQCGDEPALSYVERHDVANEKTETNVNRVVESNDTEVLDHSITSPIRVTSVFPCWTVEEMISAQEKDCDIGPVLKLLKENSAKPTWESVSHLSAESKILLVDWSRLVIHEGMLYRKWYHDNGKVNWYQLALPRKYREEVLKQLHDSATAGHAGAHRTYLKVRTRFYFPKMKQYIRLWVKTCYSCQRRKSPRKRSKAPMKVYRIGAPGERIALDIMGPFSETDAKNKWILVIGDYFTKYKVSVPLPDISAITISEALIANWISYFGCPLECHSDQGAQFTGAVFRETCKLLGIEKTRTTVGRPQSDGMIENANQALCNMLNCVVQDNPLDWDLLLRMCTLAYNSNIHDSLQETPALMMFGRELTLPIDLVMPIAEKVKQPDDYETMSAYCLDLQDRLKTVFEKARTNLGKASQRHEKSYNNRLNYQTFTPGMSVFYCNPSKGFQPKENNIRWSGPFTVEKVLTDRTYLIKKDSNSKTIVANHDRLKKGFSR